MTASTTEVAESCASKQVVASRLPLEGREVAPPGHGVLHNSLANRSTRHREALRRVSDVWRNTQGLPHTLQSNPLRGNSHAHQSDREWVGQTPLRHRDREGEVGEALEAERCPPNWAVDMGCSFLGKLVFFEVSYLPLFVL